ncbi:thiol reductant ABC exporter subunit CydD [Lentibacillus cibarius]|uniref:Thiol reductant ABC exporter subunit CydD n=1 Tax=Lentibacillus cibarius TaxID=2583219 RepID=A0A5S3QII7_9BACI|nr:thiol reductant ABC exporter subunit CydD [Lentibacillus cibarius]TMN21638.1 thiol reductant ABC exporter subunit CydD [Lentibacillus cibarius]
MAQIRDRGLPRYAGSGSLYGFLTVLIIIEVAAITAQAYFLARAVTSLFQGTPIGEVLSSIGYFFAAFMIRYAVTHLQSMLAERFAARTARMLRNKLMQAYFRSGFVIRKKGTGHLVTLAMDGVDKVKAYAEIIGIRMIKTMVIPVVIAGFIWTLDVTSALILIATVPVVIMFMILLGKTAQAKADKQYDTYKRLSNHFIDSLKGLETLVFLGQSKKHAQRINKVNTDYRKATMSTLKVAFLSSFALDFFTSISIAFVAVGLGLRLIDGTVALFPALTILILAPEYFSPIKQVGKDYHATLDGQVAMGEINELLRDDEHSAASSDVGAMAKADSTAWSLSFTDVTVALDGKTLLDQVSLDIPEGWVGVIGSSGAGKSSLIHVLAGRLAPTSGTIRIGQEEVRSLDHRDWFDRIAYIPQQPYIFPLSLADNIRFYAPDATDKQVEKVIAQISLDDLVNSLPNGIHERIGEGGRALSGGQAQRVAIARALLSEKPVILLDEPTAHLDIETEYEIKQVMRELFRDKQVILATHRLHWMAVMDHIYMLDHGSIAASGTHEALVRGDNAYATFVKGRRGEMI